MQIKLTPSLAAAILAAATVAHAAPGPATLGVGTAIVDLSSLTRRADLEQQRVERLDSRGGGGIFGDGLEAVTDTTKLLSGGAKESSSSSSALESLSSEPVADHSGSVALESLSSKPREEPEDPFFKSVPPFHKDDADRVYQLTWAGKKNNQSFREYVYTGNKGGHLRSFPNKYSLLERIEARLTRVTREQEELKKNQPALSGIQDHPVQPPSPKNGHTNAKEEVSGIQDHPGPPPSPKNGHTNAKEEVTKEDEDLYVKKYEKLAKERAALEQIYRDAQEIKEMHKPLSKNTPLSVLEETLEILNAKDAKLKDVEMNKDYKDQNAAKRKRIEGLIADASSEATESRKKRRITSSNVLSEARP